MIQNTMVTENMILISQSNTTLSGIMISNITSSMDMIYMISISDSRFSVYNVTYSDSSIRFLNSDYSTGSVNMIDASDINTTSLITIRSCTLTNMMNYNINNIEITKEYAINIIESTIESIENCTFMNVSMSVFSFTDSNITRTTMVEISNSLSGFYFENTNSWEMTQISILNCGSASFLRSAGIHTSTSNFTLTNSTFANNLADSGTGIKIDCPPRSKCESTISNCTFSNNVARTEGGAISYNLERPMISMIEFIDNIAPYGSDISSYPTKIIQMSTMSNKIYIENIGSGVVYSENLVLALIDNENQIMTTNNESAVKIQPISQDDRVTGANTAIFTQGIATFGSLELTSSPGAQNISYEISSSIINQEQLTYGVGITDNNRNEYENRIIASFRY